MKKLFITIIFIFFYSFLYAQDIDVNTRAWFTTNYVETSANKLPEQHTSLEAGLQLNLNITPHLKWNNLFVYESNYHDNKYFDYNYSFLQLSDSKVNYGGGVRLGRITMPFGFWSDTKFIPERPFVLQYYPMNMVWPYNRKLFTSIDGYAIFGFYHKGDICLELEYNRGERNELKPKVDYIQNLEGIEPDRQVVDYSIQFELGYKNFRYRTIESRLSSIFDVTPQHYRTLPFNPSEEFIGEGSINYLYRYDGIEYYSFKDFSLTLEKIDFYYLGTGTANQYYNKVWNSSLPKRKNQFWNSAFRYYGKGYELWANYGYDVFTTTKETQRGTGFSYTYLNEIIFKGQYTHSSGTQWLTWNENKNKPPLFATSTPERNWEIYAFSITYLF